jgi:hypothetical protein
MLPNYIHHSWFGADGGLACTMYGPSMVNVSLSGTRIVIVSETDYPFDSTVTFTVKSGGLTFPLLLRVPGWLESHLNVTVNGEVVQPTVDPRRSAFVRLARLWSAGDVVVVTLPLEIRATRSVTINNGWVGNRSTSAGKVSGAHTHGAQSRKVGGPPLLGGGHQNVTADLPYCIVERGPLLFALPLEGVVDEPTTCGAPLSNRDKSGGRMLRLIPNTSRETCCAACSADPACTAWVRQPSTGDCWPCRDTDGTEPATDREIFPMPSRSATFGFAVLCDAAKMSVSTASAVAQPFDWPLDAPVKIEVTAARFNWTSGPWLLPDAPVVATEKEMVNLTLIPYGCAKVYHISMFPVLHT